MSESSVTNNKRIAKNTLLLYMRTFFVMLIALYTSRVILQALGVEDYGVYNVVGGVVTMFSVITGALTTTIGRFITYELGSGNRERLKKVFATSMVVQLVIAAVIWVLVEIIGVWFLKTQMQIPEGRENAAMWVLQCSLVSFCIDLIGLPFNACITAHEHMKAFAYISLFRSLTQLGICYLIIISPFDRLISYAILMMLLSITVMFIYSIYSYKQFIESHTRIHFYKDMFKEMFSFAGWAFFSHSIYIINTQGVNMLINVYYGVVYNAARGVANQVENAVLQFANSFTTSINPQITKSYAAKELEDMFKLVCRGARFSYYLMFIMALPLICETDTILSLWLTEIPDKASVFIQLSLINCLIESMSNTTYTACVSTGRIKKYAIIVSILTILVFPLTWIVYTMDGPIEAPYAIYIVIRLVLLFVRMVLMRELVGFRVWDVIKDVYIPIVKTTVLAVIPSLIILQIMPATYLRLLISLFVGVSMVGFVSFFVGMTRVERDIIWGKLSTILYKYRNNKRI